MDMYETRRKNLKLLIDQFDGPTAMAKKLHHKGTSYISQLSTGRRPVTEKTARDIERSLKLPAGWFDGITPKGMVGPVAIDMARFTDAIKRVATALEASGLKIPPAKFADLVTYVYQESAKGLTVDVAAVLRLAAG